MNLEEMREEGCSAAIANDSWFNAEERSFVCVAPFFNDGLSVGSKVRVLNFLTDGGGDFDVMITGVEENMFYKDHDKFYFDFYNDGGDDTEEHD